MHSRNWKTIISLYLLLIAIGTSLSGCAHNIPAHTPAPLPVAPPTLPQQETVIPIELEADLTSTKAEIIKNIKEKAGAFNNDDIELAPGKHFRYTFKLAELGGGPLGKAVTELNKKLGITNPSVDLAGGEISIVARYGGDIESNFFPGCHLKPVLPIINLSFRPGIEQQGSNFILGALDPNVVITTAENSDTKCGALGWGNLFVDVEKNLKNGFNSPAIKNPIMSLIQKNNKVIPLKALSDPIEIDYQPFAHICLYTNPLEISQGKIQGNMNKATVDFLYRGFPAILVADKCPASTPVPISVKPNIILKNEEPFKVYVPVTVSYSSLSSLLTGYYSKNKSISIGNWNFQVDKIEARDNGGHVQVAVTMSGDVNGTIYLWGTPKMRANNTILEFSDFYLALESKTILDSFKIGLAQLILGDFKNKVIPLTVFDLRNSISDARTALSKSHRIGDASLTLNVNPQLGQGADPIFSRPEGIIVNVMMQGSAKVSISKF